MERGSRPTSALIGFEPIGANIYIRWPYLGTGLLKGEPKLSFSVKLSKGEAISVFPDDKVFEKWQGAVMIVAESDQTSRTGEGVIGSVEYCPTTEPDYLFPTSPATYLVEAIVEKNEFDELLSAARLGRFPSKILINVNNIEFDSCRTEAERNGM